MVASILMSVLASCGGSGTGADSAPSGGSYGHPGASSGGSAGGGVSSVVTGRLTRIVDGKAGEDLTIELGTTSITIRAGTFQRDYQAVVTDLAGEFTESSSIKFLNLPVRLRITDEDSVLERADAARDIEFTLTSVKSAELYKSTVLLADYAEARATNIKEPTRRFARVSTLGSDAGTNAEGKLVAKVSVRSPDIGLVLAQSTSGNPPGFDTDAPSPRDPESFVAVANEAPDKVDLTWRAERIGGQGFSVAFALAPVAPLCGKSFDLVATETSAAAVTGSSGKSLYEFKAQLSGLTDNKTYALRLCSSDGKTTVTYSGPGALTAVTTVKRAEAVLSGTPSALTNVDSISVTIGGVGSVEYKHVLAMAPNCDGVTWPTTWTAVATPITASSLPDGTHRLCVLARKSVKNEQLVPTQFSWTVDTIPPDITASPPLIAPLQGGGAYLNVAMRSDDTAVHAAATVTGSSARFYKQVDSSATCSSETYSGANDVLVKSGQFSADGSAKICVKAVDAAGNASFDASRTFNVDLTPPTLTAAALANDAADGYINDAEKSSTSDLIAAPVASEVVTAAYKVVASSASCDSQSGYGGVVPKANDAALGSDGTYKVCVKVTDAAGNTGYGASPPFIRDTTYPTRTSGLTWTGAAVDGYINDSEKSGASAIITAVAASEAATFQYGIVDSVAACDGNVTYSTSIPTASHAAFASDGDYKACARMQDVAGNIAYATSSSNVTRDTAAPSASMTLANAATDGFVNSAERGSGSAAMGSYPSGSSDLASSDYKLIPSTTTCGPALSFGSTIPAATSSDFGADGAYAICMRFIDLAGNVGYATSATITLDTTAPTLTSAALANEAADGFINDLEKSATGLLIDAATVSEASTVTYKLAPAATICSGAVGYSSSIPQINDPDFGSDGTYKVCVKMVDPAGNLGFGSSVNIVRDTVYPSKAGGLTWTGDAADGYINDSEKAGSSALLTAATADEASTYSYGIVTSSTTCDGSVTYGASIPTASHAAFTGEVAYKACVRMEDLAGNVAYAASATDITRDTVSPSATMALANAASDGMINASEKASLSTAMGASPVGSETLSATTYKLVASATACDGSLSYGVSIPAANSLDFGSDGNYKICMRLVDSAGNIGYSASAAIILDTTGPVFTSIAFANEASDGYINNSEKNATTDLVATPVTSGADATSYVVVANAAACNTASGYGSTKPKVNDAAITADGSWKVCVKLEDTAGNVTYGSSGVVVRDTVVPTLASGFAWTGDASDSYLNSTERTSTSAVLTAAVANESSTYKFTIVPLLGSCATASDYASGIPGADTTKITTDGGYLGCVEITDLAGNVTRTQSSTPITVDTVASSATMALANAASDGMINASEKASLSTAIGDSPAGSETLSATTYKLVTSATTCDASLVYGASIPAANSSDFGSDGNYKICMRLVDSAGNVGYSASGTIILDTTGPVFTSVAFANEASDGYISNSEKALTSDLVGNPVTSGASATSYVVIANSGTCSSASGYSATKPKLDDSAMSGDGSWKVCVKLEDTGGNITYGSSAAVVKDTVAPTLASGFTWGGPAWDAYLNATERTTSTAILSAAVASESSTYKYLLVTSSASCASATFSSSSLPAANSSDITVDGDYKGCVQMTDLAGNVSVASTTSYVNVDTPAPTATMTLANDAAGDGLISAAEHASGNMAMGDTPTGSSDLASVSYKLIPKSTTCGSALAFGGTIPRGNSGDFSADAVYVICMRLVDNAGNVGFASSPDITLDASPATLSSLSLANDAADGYINDSEKSSTSGLTAAATTSETGTLAYLVTGSGSSCSAQSGYSSSIPAANDSNFNGDGTWKVCVRMTDAAGNVSYGASGAIVRDTLAPILASGLAWSGAAIGGYLSSAERSLTTAIVTAAVANETATYNYSVIDASASCAAAVYSSTSVPAANTTLISAEGSWKVCVRMMDNAGNTSYAATSSSVIVDVTSPAISSFPLVNAASDGYVNAAERTLSTPLAGPLSASADLSSAQYKLIPSTTSCAGALSFVSSIPQADSPDFSGDGSYRICVRLEDNAGNVAYDTSSQFTLDATAPVFTSIALANSASDGYINAAESSSTDAISGSAVSSGADSTQYRVAASSSACASLTGFSGSVPAINDAIITGDGSWKVCIRLADTAGNVTFGASSTIVRDTVAPALSGTPALQPPADDLYLNSADRTSQNAFIAAAAINEAGTAQYVVSTGDCSTAGGYSASIPAANTLAITGDGTWKVCVKMTDTAGNVGYGSSANFTVDTSGPVFTSLSLAGAATDGYITADENQLTSDLAGSLVASGYSADDYKLVSATTTCGTPLTFGGMPKANSAAFAGDGSYKVCVRLADAAGNLTYGASDPFVLDTGAPVFTSIDLANLALDGYLSASDRNGTSGITGTLTASGYSTIQYRSAPAATACSSVGSWSASAPLANDVAIMADGSWKVCVKLSDAAGNATYGASSSFTVETSAATLSAALSLANAASDGYISSQELSLSSALIASPSFNKSVTTTYALVTSATDCSTVIAWPASIPLASAFGSSPFNSDGVYKICVRAVDNAGNTAWFASPSITRDTTAPSFTSLALADAVADGYLNATERGLSTVVAGSLVAEAGATASYVAASSATTCDGSLTYSSSIPAANDAAFAADGNWKICVRLQDAAGNVGYGSSTTFVVDTVPASFGSVALANSAADGYLSAADRALTTSISAPASATGADSIFYAVIQSTSNCGSGVTFGAAGVRPNANTTDIATDGSWKICVKVMDVAGNAADYGTSAAFIVDTVNPSSTVSTSGALTITSTSGSTTTIEGTTSDTSPSSGVASVVVSIDDGSGNCLNNSRTAWNAACPNWINASTGSATWSVSVDDAMFLKGASYGVSVKATDAAGNQQASATNGSYTWEATEGSDLWNKNVTFNGSNAAQVLASAVDSQGRLVVVGYDTSGGTRGRIKRYTRNGVEDATIDITIGNGTNAVVAYGVAIGGSDSIFVVGSQSNGSNNDWFIRKYSSSGVEDTVNWNKTYNGSRGDDDVAYVVAIASDGKVVVGGHSRRAVSSSSGDDWRIMKYDSNGALACSQDVDIDSQAKDDRIKSLAIRNVTSMVYVAGWSDSPGTSRGWALGEFSLSNCALQSKTVITRGSSDEAQSLVIDSSGQLVVAGKTTEFATSPDMWIEVMSTSFVTVCAIRNDVAALGEALTVAVDSLDNIYVGGYRTGVNENWWLRKFSSACSEDTSNWNRIVNGTGNGNDRIQSISISAGSNDVDNIYVVGWGFGAVSGSGNNDWWVKKYSGAQ